MGLFDKIGKSIIGTPLFFPINPSILIRQS